MSDVAEFVEALYALDRTGRKAGAIDLAIAYFNDAQHDGRLADCSAAFKALDPFRLSSSVCVSVLGITLRSRDVDGRRDFWHRTYRRVACDKGCGYARRLLRKYR